MDNVRFHHSNDVKLWCKRKNIIIKYIPPYSPDLNPIENVFSTFKSRYSAIRPFASTNTMVKEYIGQVITNMNEDPTIIHERYFERMTEYIYIWLVMVTIFNVFFKIQFDFCCYFIFFVYYFVVFFCIVIF